MYVARYVGNTHPDILTGELYKIELRRFKEHGLQVNVYGIGAKSHSDPHLIVLYTDKKTGFEQWMPVVV